MEQLLQDRRQVLRPTTTTITTAAGQRFVVDGAGHRTEAPPVYGFVVDTRPDAALHPVRPRLFISSQDGAANKAALELHGITHVVNAAEGVANFFPEQLHYCNVALLDIDTERLVTPALAACLEWMDAALQNPQAAVLVHCNAGISRSASVIIAHLMRTERLTYAEALDVVRAGRPGARPNDGFARQLQQLEAQQAQ
eukprot:TRINITY_DN9178_c0_g1_i6.p1 TRINITY_DN9178_c0_g1~~TRINITY_DN9178_c0_g1_i6.p1  ORF type:complete len:209 (-),score=49.13 TRINITY_DN9178_c0_g1_i6:27-617(-)